uniref:FERM domain-containing protein n=1 Tax=Esox lucius TaxID=8010 RepID=A0A3P8YUW5_ESOLU
MTTEPGSESSADQQETSVAPPPLEADSFPPAAAHSTPVRKEQVSHTHKYRTRNQLDPSQVDEDRTSHRSSTSKLSRSPGGGRSVRSYRNMQCKVTLLDGTDYTCLVEKRERGHVLFDKVCEHLNLLEKDYFGITFRDVENQKNWLDPSKEMKKQIRGVAWNFSFNVKFYPPDPAQLSEDITRYYLCLQLRDDVVSGRLPCSFATHTVLGSYTVQSELGDYDPEESGIDYVSEFRFAPNQTKELEEKVMDLHKNYKGMTPAEAEMHFLENVKKLSMYGVDLHHAKDSEGVEIMLGVCSSGLLIYRDRLRINRFAWPKVLKISYKRNNFYIKIRPGEFEQFESTIGFKLPNHRAAKRLWKVCVEHHTFFRLVSPETPPKKFLNLGSKFRYSGRTQAQTRRASAQIVRPAPRFERSTSKRYIMSRSLDGEMGSDLYGRAKGIAMSDLITTVTPEKKVEERKAEEEVDVKVPTSPIRHDTKVQFSTPNSSSILCPRTSFVCNTFRHTFSVMMSYSILHANSLVGLSSDVFPWDVLLLCQTELTDTAVDGELTATEVLETPEELLKHATNISELKRSFMETGVDKAGLTEWEKRLSSSPLRSPRHDEAPMIEPLELDEDPCLEVAGVFVVRERTGHGVWSVSSKPQLCVDVPRGDANTNPEAGILMSAQTITSETTSTTTTTHITKTVKGGISETRIEKRIVISGDADIDHDEALAQAIKEAREQHPDMSVTKVVVHKETEITPEKGEE